MIRLEVTLCDIDYEDIVERFLPQLLDHLKKDGGLSAMLLSGDMPEAAAKALLTAMSRERKDKLAADLINNYSVQIMEAGENLARKERISVGLAGLRATVPEPAPRPADDDSAEKA